MEAFHSLIANFSPVTKSFSWKGRSSPNLDPAAQNRSASAEYFSIIARGSTTLPLLFDIFLPCGSCAWPEITQSFHGPTPKCNRDFTTVLNSQNVMMSCACGLRDIGNSFFLISGFLTRSVAICGVSDDVAHVSITSASGTNSPHPHFRHFAIGGLSFKGSTGKSFSSASTISSHFLQYHRGKGTPKNLCREIIQSHCRPLTQCSYLCRMCSGYQFSFLPHSSMSSFRSRYLMNHCLVFRISTSVPQRSCTFTECLIAFCAKSSPSFLRSAIISFLASGIVFPAYLPATEVILPSRPIAVLIGRL